MNSRKPKNHANLKRWSYPDVKQGTNLWWKMNGRWMAMGGIVTITWQGVTISGMEHLKRWFGVDR